ncbi:hypothetical protein ASALC70_01503 [Alcanivorax sp. ALC70]|nr:hypothetical protein ASALC70_01503 [Alcanivorax sp. ALC70]
MKPDSIRALGPAVFDAPAVGLRTGVAVGIKALWNRPGGRLRIFYMAREAVSIARPGPMVLDSVIFLK